MGVIPRYTELQCASHFSFLRGASSCEELFATAEAHGLEALAITDRNSLAGIVRAYDAARTTGVRLIVGCRLDLVEGHSLLVYPIDRTGYARLCRLLSRGKQRGGKGKCLIGWDDARIMPKGCSRSCCRARLRKPSRQLPASSGSSQEGATSP